MDEFLKERISLVDDFIKKAIVSLDAWKATKDPEHIEIAMYFLVMSRGYGTLACEFENTSDRDTKTDPGVSSASEVVDRIAHHILTHKERFSWYGRPHTDENLDGVVEQDVVWIKRHAFNNILNDNGFQVLDTLRLLKHNGQISVKKDERAYTKRKRINGTLYECVCVNLCMKGYSDATP